MIFFATNIDFLQPSGIIRGISGLFFDDRHLIEPIPLSESGLRMGVVTGLDSRFISVSIMGALNELKQNIIDASGSSSNPDGVFQLNGLSGFVTIVSPSGSIKITKNISASQLNVDIDLISSGVGRGFVSELLPPSVVFTVTHGLNTRNILYQLYDKNPYYNPDAQPIIAVVKPFANNSVQVVFEDGIAASGYLVLNGAL